MMHLRLVKGSVDAIPSLSFYMSYLPLGNKLTQNLAA